jgi:hypothetical protein
MFLRKLRNEYPAPGKSGIWFLQTDEFSASCRPNVNLIPKKTFGDLAFG